MNNIKSSDLNKLIKGMCYRTVGSDIPTYYVYMTKIWDTNNYVVGLQVHPDSEKELFETMGSFSNVQWHHTFNRNFTGPELLFVEFWIQDYDDITPLGLTLLR